MPNVGLTQKKVKVQSLIYKEMKKYNITKREIKFFILGVLTVVIIDLLFSWRDFSREFLDGSNGTRNETRK